MRRTLRDGRDYTGWIGDDAGGCRVIGGGGGEVGVVELCPHRFRLRLARHEQLEKRCGEGGLQKSQDQRGIICPG
jgi:hypothetical protein